MTTATELFQVANEIQQLLIKFDKLALELIAESENKALAHQVITQSSRLFTGKSEGIKETIKYALDNCDLTTPIVTPGEPIAGIELKSMVYAKSTSNSIELMDDSPKAWGFILQACAKIEPTAVQKRLTASVFTDKRKGHALLMECAGLVGVKENTSISIKAK